MLEKIAGKHRVTALESILSNRETLIRAYETAMNSSGSAMEEFEKRTKSVEYHLNQLEATWQEVASDTISSETVINFIDMAKAALELANDIGVLKIAFSGLTTIGFLGITTKVVPYFESIALTMKDANGQVELFGKMYTVQANGVTTKSAKMVGAVKTVTTSLKALGKTAALGLALTVLVTVGEKIAEAFDNAKHKVENLTNSINDLTSEVDTMQSEVDELNSKQFKTAEDEARIKLLKEQIALKKELIEVQKQLKADTVVSDAKNYFDGKQPIIPFLSSDFSNKMSGAKKSVEAFTKACVELEAYNNRMQNLKETLPFVYDLYQKLGIIVSDNNGLVKEQNKTQEEAISKISELTEERENLVFAIENSIGSQKEEAQTQLENLDAEIESLSVQAGLKKSIEDLSDTIKNSSSAVDVLTAAQDKASRTATLTKEELDRLKQEYPELTEEILKHVKQTQDGYTLEEEAIALLTDKVDFYKDNSIEAQIELTEKTKEEALKRIEIYKAEMEVLSGLFSSITSSYEKITSGEQKASPLVTSRAAQYEQNKKKLEEKGVKLKGDETFTDPLLMTIQRQISEKQTEINEAQKTVDEALKTIDELEKKINNSGSGGGSGSGSNSENKTESKNVDVWDKYANELDKVKEKLESLDAQIDITQSKLDFNQSKENRTPEVLAEEQKLYDELIAKQKERYKITNDTLYLQREQLKTIESDAKAQIAKRSPEYDIGDFENWTKADVEKYIECELKVDTSEADANLANYLNYLLEFKSLTDETFKEWYEQKQELLESAEAKIQVHVDWQNNTLDKFDEARGNAELLLDILEEMENTEQNRLTLVNDIAKTYDSEMSVSLQMYDATVKEMVDLAKEGKQDGNEYNVLLNQRRSLEESMLNTIKNQLAYRKKEIEIQKEIALKQAETSVYGKQGKESWESTKQAEIDRLQKQLDALSKDDSEETYLEEVEEKEKTIAKLEEKLANLRQQKTIQQLKQNEDGSFDWEYVVDQKAIDETLEELEEAKSDLRKTHEEKELQDQKDAIQSQIDAIEEEIEDKESQYDILTKQTEEYWAEQLRIAEEASMQQIEDLEKHIKSLTSELDTMAKETKKGLEGVSEKTQKGLENLSGVYDVWFSDFSQNISGYVNDVISEFFRLIEAQRQAAAEAAEMTGGSVKADGSHANGLKFVEANNYIARLHYGERVLTRQEAEQYNKIEDDIKSNRLQMYFDSLKKETALSFSDAASASIRSNIVPETTNNSTSFVIEHLELPNVQQPTDFAAVINNWARGEFGGLAQKARITKAK